MYDVHVILRTCNNSTLQQNITSRGIHRICGDDRNTLITKCVKSLITTINNSKNTIKLTVLDDNSDVTFIHTLKEILQACKSPVTWVSLEISGFNFSAYQQFSLAASSKELIYTVEDDYLHEPNAIDNMVTAYSVLKAHYNDNIMISPFDCPFRYQLNSIEPTVLLHDGTRYWRHTAYTTHTFLTHASIIQKHFTVFETLAVNYPKEIEDTTINLLYKNIYPKTNTDILVFNPIPSVAYHMAYSEPPKIKTPYLSWEPLWDLY